MGVWPITFARSVDQVIRPRMEWFSWKSENKRAKAHKKPEWHFARVACCEGGHSAWHRVLWSTISPVVSGWLINQPQGCGQLLVFKLIVHCFETIIDFGYFNFFLSWFVKQITILRASKLVGCSHFLTPKYSRVAITLFRNHRKQHIFGCFFNAFELKPRTPWGVWLSDVLCFVAWCLGFQMVDQVRNVFVNHV